MPEFSASSVARLSTCDERLRVLFNEVIQSVDCTILEGKRSEEAQRRNVERGVSKTMDSKHVYPLRGPALAADVAPWPLRWPKIHESTYVKDVARYYWFAGYVKAVAERLGIPIRWGGDWDGDNIFIDQVFDDLVHFELKEV